MFLRGLEIVIFGCGSLMTGLFFGKVMLLLEMTDMLIGEGEKRVLNYIWKSPTPLKVLAFSWTLLQDRIPTWVNLALRRVLGGGGRRAFVVGWRSRQLIFFFIVR